MSPATSLLQILTPTRGLIATAHNQQVASVKAAAMGMGIITDEDEEAERTKRREHQAQMRTRKCPSRNPRMGRRKPSLRTKRAAGCRIRRTKKDEHES